MYPNDKYILLNARWRCRQRKHALPVNTGKSDVTRFSLSVQNVKGWKAHKLRSIGSGYILRCSIITDL